ncbi:YihY family inner membrane protein [Acidovorax sp. sif1233]|uniref:YihY family inner membrane protein n=1 Tax=unclassified Acidovorax TaxID=2684926 RepID=UPI001C46E9EE|nr:MULTISPECIES: YihY family inner membrane protein [unclassified Acidovorax]MBV7431106.1 YihY family inner membrane protein [Acidovorax sp. sif0732]MBV7452212.1 YihY family inner membrane protein [Acidovorax sp. sif0715]MBV7457628.1 YihY family inner membrane protein [Acidovorax sp. sif1233]
MPFSLQTVASRFEALITELSHFPWKTTALTLRERFREDHLGLTASSLTFTTILALVPFFAVALAVFTAFPIFGKLQDVLQRWLVDSLVPDSISRQVLGYLTQFAAKASGLGVAGFSILLATALALILTIDRTLNDIWRVQRLRPLGQRVLIYWAAITLGPLLMGASLALTSYVMSASGGLVKRLPDGVQLLFDSIQFLVLAAGMASLYHYVPNTPVKWRHAWTGGLFVAVCMELAKKVLALYLGNVPTYSVVYGAFATLPILLIWIYVAWVIVLLGAVVTAYLPSLLAGVARRGTVAGWTFQLAVEVLQELHRARFHAMKGLRPSQLAQRLRVDMLQLEPVLEALTALDWVGQVSDAAMSVSDVPESRYVLLIDPQNTPLEPLVHKLLLERSTSLEPLWARAGLGGLHVRDVLQAE